MSLAARTTCGVLSHRQWHWLNADRSLSPALIHRKKKFRTAAAALFLHVARSLGRVAMVCERTINYSFDL